MKKSHGTKARATNPDEEMRRTANDLIQVAIAVFMKMHSVGRKTAQRWVASAVETAAEDRKQTRKSR